MESGRLLLKTNNLETLEKKVFGAQSSSLICWFVHLSKQSLKKRVSLGQFLSVNFRKFRGYCFLWLFIKNEVKGRRAKMVHHLDLPLPYLFASKASMELLWQQIQCKWNFSHIWLLSRIPSKPLSLSFIFDGRTCTLQGWKAINLSQSHRESPVWFPLSFLTALHTLDSKNEFQNLICLCKVKLR